MAEVEMIPVRLLRADGGTQARVALNDDAVAEYTDAYSGSGGLPPLDVVFDGEHYWVWDGLHRHHAAARAGAEAVPCHVRAGTVEDARWLACGANRSHGVKRTNADKRRAVEMALGLRPDMSDRAIAEWCGVDHKTVSAARASGEIPQMATRTVTRGGTTYTQDTSAIGKREPQPPAAPPPATAATAATSAGDEGDATEEAESSPAKDEATDAAAEDDPGPTDEGGVALPPQAVEAFALVPELRKACRALDEASREIERLGKSPLGRHINWQSAQQSLAAVKSSVWQRRPAHVCPYCRGGQADCQGCRGCGWVTAPTYKAAPPELREGA